MAVAAKHQRLDIRALLFFLIVTLTIGFLGSLPGGFETYSTLKAPPLAPPAQVFLPVWVALYVMMAVAAYLVWNTDSYDRAPSLRLYLLQLVVNALWPLFFFRLEWRLFAFFWIMFLIALITLTMAGFKYLRLASYWLMVPYLLWVLFAAYLNLGFFLLNSV